MTNQTKTPEPTSTGSAESGSMASRRLPRFAPVLALAVCLAAGILIATLLGGGWIGGVFLGLLLLIVLLPLWSMLVENRRAAVDRLITCLIWVALGIAMIPLVSMLWMVIKNGAPALNGKFFTWSMRNIVGEPGGIYHALIGTVYITAFAAIISIPVGILTAIYTVEYGATSKLTKAVRFLTDVMTGIPSIVAGLFAYALFGMLFGVGFQSGFAGSVALSILMVPIVVRSTEEMLKLVPHDLREASYALGVPKWKTILKVVIPTALAGILTGVTLSIARVIGETAPLLIACGFTSSTNYNPFGNPMESLPVFIYYSYTQPGVPPEILIQMAWGAALVLILVVLLLNVLARVLGRTFAPKTGR